MAYPKHLSVVMHEKNILSFNHRAQSYVIGLQNRAHANIVKRIINKQSLDNIMLLRHCIDDVSDDINRGLHTLGMDEMSVEDVTIDVAATLIIPKKKMTSVHDLLPTNVGQIAFEDFLMLPFTHHIGVAMPFEILEDSDKQLVFQTQVIDPTQDVEAFRRNLVI